MSLTPEWRDRLGPEDQVFKGRINGTRQIYKDVLAIRILGKYKFGMIFAIFVATSLVVPCARV
jgi:hypothetical protein